MPIFSSKRKSRKKDENSGVASSSPSTALETSTISANISSSSRSTSNRESSKSSSPNTTHRSNTNRSSTTDKYSDQPKLIFHCQLAHGSPTGLISGFSNVKELYKKIADCFEIPVSTVRFTCF